MAVLWLEELGYAPSNACPTLRVFSFSVLFCSPHVLSLLDFISFDCRRKRQGAFYGSRSLDMLLSTLVPLSVFLFLAVLFCAPLILSLWDSVFRLIAIVRGKGRFMGRGAWICSFQRLSHSACLCFQQCYFARRLSYVLVSMFFSFIDIVKATPVLWDEEFGYAPSKACPT